MLKPYTQESALSELEEQFIRDLCTIDQLEDDLEFFRELQKLQDEHKKKYKSIIQTL